MASSFKGTTMTEQEGMTNPNSQADMTDSSNFRFLDDKSEQLRVSQGGMTNPNSQANMTDSSNSRFLAKSEQLGVSKENIYNPNNYGQIPGKYGGCSRGVWWMFLDSTDSSLAQRSFQNE